MAADPDRSATDGGDAAAVLAVLTRLSRDLGDPDIGIAAIGHRTTAALTTLPGVAEARLVRLPGGQEVSRAGTRPRPPDDPAPDPAPSGEAGPLSTARADTVIRLGSEPWGLLQIAGGGGDALPDPVVQALALVADRVALAIRDVEARDGTGRQSAIWALIEALGARLDAGMTLPEALHGEAATLMSLMRADGLLVAVLGERLSLGCTEAEQGALLDLCRTADDDTVRLEGPVRMSGLPDDSVAAVAVLPIGEEDGDGLILVRRHGRGTPSTPFSGTARRDLTRLHQFIRERAALAFMRRRGLLGRLLTTISRAVLTHPPSAAMPEALSTLCGAVGADMAAVIVDETASGARRTSAFHWVRPDRTSTGAAHPTPPSVTSPALRALLARGGMVRLPQMETAPPESRPLADHMAQQGVRSLLALPLLHRGGLVGSLCLLTITETRAWSDWDVRLAGLAAEILGHALLREGLELAHAASEDRFRALFHQSGEPLFLLDHDARLLDANRQAEDVTGYTLDEWRHRRLDQVVRLAGRPLSRVDLLSRLSALGPGQPEILEVEHQRSDGASVPLQLTLRRFEHQGLALYVVSVLDISDRRAAEAAQRRRSARDELMLTVAKRFVRDPFRSATEAALADVGLFLSLHAVMVQEPRGPGITPETRFVWTHSPTGRTLMDIAAGLPKARLGLEVGRPWSWSGPVPPDIGGADDQLVIRAAPVRVDHRVVAQVVLLDIGPPGRSGDDEDGRLLAFLCEMYAIALSRLRDRSARADTEQRLEAFARNLPGGVWRRVLMPDGGLRYTYFSGGVTGFGSVTPDRVLETANTLLDTVHPDDRAAMLDSIHESARTLRDWVREFRTIDDSGAVRWMHAAAKTQRLPDGTIAWDGITLDITARKRFEQALLESESRFRAAFNQAAEGMALIGPHGRWLRVNQSLAALLGTTPEAVVGTSVARAVHPDDRQALRARWRQASAEAGDVLCAEVRLVCRDGSTPWIQAKAAPVCGGDGRLRYWVALVQDISTRRATQALLVRARDQAEATARAKSEFLAMMSHEIRTPLVGMIGLAGLLQGAALPPNQMRHAGRIESAGRLLLRMLDDILTLSRAESGHLAVTREPFSPAGLLSEVIGLLSVNAEAKGLRLTLALDPALPVWVEGPGPSLRQVLVNLVGNAIKFTETGRIMLRARPAEMTLHEGGARPDRPDGPDTRRLRVEVEDTGIGIAPDSRAHVFDLFTQGDSRPDGVRAGGVGLGLAICRRLVQAMGGDIGVDSTPGRGSLFWVTVPVQEVPSSAARPGDGVPCGASVGDDGPSADPLEGDYTPADPATMAPRPGRGPSLTEADQGTVASSNLVMIVDDDDINREVVAATLNSLGYATVCFADGMAAIRSATADHIPVPGLVLMDINMPGLDGAETTKRLRALGPSWRAVPVIGVTAGALSLMENRIPPCCAAGMQDCLVKPVEVADLRRVLGRRRPLSGAPDRPHPALQPHGPRPGAVGPIRDAVPDPGWEPGWEPGSDLEQEGSRPLLDEVVWQRRVSMLGTARLREHVDGLWQTGAALRAWASDRSPMETEAAARLAHRIRGAAATLGAGALAQAAGGLERALVGDPAGDGGADPRAASVPLQASAAARGTFVAVWDGTQALLSARLGSATRESQG